MTQMAVEQAIKVALAHHRAGRLAEAERLYRAVLVRFPEHHAALHWLGVLAAQMGDTNRAVELIKRSIAIVPHVAEYHSNLGEIYCRLGQWEATIACCRCAVKFNPDLAAAHGNLGTALKAGGQLDEAVAAYRRALALKPQDADIQSNLGVALHAAGRIDEAIALLARAAERKPDQGGIHGNLGNALRDRGRIDEAIAAYHRATQLEPHDSAAHYNLGNALMNQGRPEAAIAAYRRAIECRPDSADVYNNLGSALTDLGRLDEAISAYRRAIALKPDLAEAHSNLGITLYEQGRLESALAACRHAVRLRPDYAEAHNNLGTIFKGQGRLDEAIASFRTALAVKPHFARAASNPVLTLHYHPEQDARSLLAEHRAWAERYADPLAPHVHPHSNDRTLDRRLRVGYVSPDFRDHPVGRLLLPLFAHHDHQQIEVIGYSDVPAGDAVTAQLRTLTDRWHSVVGLSDALLAERIRADWIDILVDLAVHTAHNRLLVFARKPAPVQVTMLGMPSTTGLATMDYRLTDPYLDPPGETDGDYIEQSIRLPHCYWCYHPPEDAPPVGPLPAWAKGFVTFGCLNNFTKVSRPALELWARVLQALPSARLVLLSHPGTHLDAARGMFQAAGLGGERVTFAAPRGRRAYLELYHHLDLSVDPFPYNGHSTTLDSLWMGVPVITLAGRTAVGRGGVSILSHVGLPELIARTPEEYVAIALEWALDLTRLSKLRAALREQMLASPLTDGKQFAADVESAFRGMWKRWCGS